MAPTTRVRTRRTFLKGAAVGAGAGAAQLAGCSRGSEADGKGVFSRRVNRVVLDPFHPTWQDTPYRTVALGPQQIALPQRIKPSVNEMRVRSVHDGERIGFWMEWADRNVNDLTVRVDDFRDACAVLLAEGEGDEGLRMMGTQAVPATLLHWKADWQRMVVEGDEGLDVAFPNRSVDTYPIVWETPPDEVGIDSYVAAGATEWLPAIHVANPVSGRATRSRAAEKAIAYGFSTTTTAKVQDVVARGENDDAGWRVVITKPMKATDEGEIDLKPGSVATCAFAVWSGSSRDVGSRKCPANNVAVLEIEK